MDTDNTLKKIDDAGTVTSLEAAGGLTDPMTTRGDIIVRNASNVTARLAIGSTGKVLSSNGTDVSWQTPAGGSGGASILLDHTRATDITALTVTANTWTDIIANLNFTPASASSIVEIAVRAAGFFTGNSGQAEVSSRVNVDSGGTPVLELLGGTTTESGAQRGNPFAGSGSIFLSGLAASAHTVKVQVFINSSNTGFYLRPTGSANGEFLRIQVIEHLN